jgi:malate synthase
MEDAATAEISRTQVWQWIRHEAVMTNGQKVDAELVKRMTREELEKIRGLVGGQKYDAGKFDRASSLFLDMMTRLECPEFLTLICYDVID